jgi:hypothetical protein
VERHVYPRTVQCDDDEIRFVLDQHAELDLYSASSLKQQCVGRHVAPMYFSGDHTVLFPLPFSTGLCPGLNGILKLFVFKDMRTL